MDERKLRLIASLYCSQYKTDAKLYIEDPHPSGQRHLVAQYEKGGYGGDSEFAAAIPDSWTTKDITGLIFWPKKYPKTPYPAWEIPARAFGRAELFRWWSGGKPT